MPGESKGIFHDSETQMVLRGMVPWILLSAVVLFLLVIWPDHEGIQSGAMYVCEMGVKSLLFVCVWLTLRRR